MNVVSAVVLVRRCVSTIDFGHRDSLPILEPRDMPLSVVAFVTFPVFSRLLTVVKEAH